MDRNYKKYQSIGSNLIFVGIIFMGMYLASFGKFMDSNFIIGSVFLLVLSLIFITAGVFLKKWANKNKPAEPKQKLSDEEIEKRVTRAIGMGMIRIAGIILCINVFCRVLDAVESKDYIQVMGTVTDAYTSNSSLDYNVRVDYQPKGESWTACVSESYSSSMFKEGQAVPVLYRGKPIYDEYIAKKDWMTGAYLRAEKWYNVPFVIAVVLFILGVLFYTDSPILEWYANAGTNIVGEIKARKPKTIENVVFKETSSVKFLNYEIPQEYQNRSDILVCHYCTWPVAILAGFLFSAGLIPCIGGIGSLVGGNLDLLEILTSLGMSICAIIVSGAGGWLFLKYMKNWTVIFHKDGVWHRNMAGEVSIYTDAEVKWYIITSGSKYCSITLGTEPKRVYINSFASNYQLVKQWVRQKYQEL